MIAGLAPTVLMGTRTPALAWIVLVLMMDSDDHTITSMDDLTHDPHSAHYRGEAVDIRSHDLQTMDQKRARVARLKYALGAAFTVLLEPYDVPGSTAAEHIHIQLAKGVGYHLVNLGDDISLRWVRTLPPPDAVKA